LGEVPVSLDGLLAVVSNKPVTLPVPCIDPDDIKGLSDLIVKHFPKRRTEA